MPDNFRPGETIKGMHWRVDPDTHQAIRDAVHSMDPEYLEMLTNNPTFLDKIADKLSANNVDQSRGVTHTGFLASSPLGERMRESIQAEEDVSLPTDVNAWSPVKRPKVARSNSVAPSQTLWAPSARPSIPADQQPSQRGLGETTETGLGKLLALIGAAGGIFFLGLKLLGGKDVEVVSEDGSRRMRNPDEDDLDAEESATPVFPYDKTLSLGRNSDELYTNAADEGKAE